MKYPINPYQREILTCMNSQTALKYDVIVSSYEVIIRSCAGLYDELGEATCKSHALLRLWSKELKCVWKVCSEVFVCTNKQKRGKWIIVTKLFRNMWVLQGGSGSDVKNSKINKITLHRYHLLLQLGNVCQSFHLSRTFPENLD